MQKVKSKRWGG